MKLSFMTLGCPQWTLDDVCRHGREYGFDAVDFRGLGAELDVTRLPAFSTGPGGGLEETARRLASAGLAVSGVSSSLNVCSLEKRERDLEEARRTIPVALALGAKNIRVFGGTFPDSVSRNDAAAIGADTMGQILAMPGADKLNWLFETHDEWIAAKHCKLLVDRVNHPSFGILWDMGHTYRVLQEKPADTWKTLGQWVRYCHVKDATFDSGNPDASQGGWRYALPGTGQLPLAESIRLIKAAGYNGYLLFEHEKRWHPTLPEPEEAFPAFVKWARRLLG